MCPAQCICSRADSFANIHYIIHYSARTYTHPFKPLNLGVPITSMGITSKKSALTIMDFPPQKSTSFSIYESTWGLGKLCMTDKKLFRTLPDQTQSSKHACSGKQWVPVSELRGCAHCVISHFSHVGKFPPRLATCGSHVVPALWGKGVRLLDPSL